MISSVSQNICKLVDSLTEGITQLALEPNPKTVQGDYFEILSRISKMVAPLFEKIHKTCKDAGLERAALLVAAPRVRVENFVFLVENSETKKVTDVVLAKNLKYKFLMNGGGKTRVGETYLEGAKREAKEEFNYSGELTYLTTESESGMPSFAFGKGVYVGKVSPELAPNLKLADDMSDKELCKMPVTEFLDVTDKDTKPMDHGFDRKWIAKYIREGKVSKEFNQRTLTKEDVEAAVKFHEWEKGIKFNCSLCQKLEQMILKETEKMNFEGKMKGSWRDKDKREAITASAQKLVNLIMQKVGLPEWKCGEKTALQLKVADGQGFTVDKGVLLPSFLTTPQYVAQKMLKDGATTESLIGKSVTVC
jgi:hypothetical protein